MQGLFGFYTGFIIQLRCLPSCFLFYLLFLVTSYFASLCFISSVSRIFRPTLFHCHELQYMAALWLKYSRHVRHCFFGGKKTKAFHSVLIKILNPFRPSDWALSIPDTDTKCWCDRRPQAGHNAGTSSASPQTLLPLWSSKHLTNLRDLNSAVVLCSSLYMKL